MKKIGKRKIVTLTVLVLCLAVCVTVFIMFRKWLHSDGMHFVGGYGQVHLTKMCEGMDQDGNKIESRNVIVDGTISEGSWKFWRLEFGGFNGTINVEELPELIDVFEGGVGCAIKRDKGTYEVAGIIFLESPLSRERRGRKEFTEEDDPENRSCYANLWLKDNEVAMEFHQRDFHSENYYIFYSDAKMLDIPEIRKLIKDKR
ncbi:MAG: hypothetical protein HFH72_14480 [Lachnospiraceae bacterium]|nr:hypothetical protein [Lachnospiraceae bacterium]